VLLAAFSGWVDAGYSGQGALRYLITHASGARTAAVDLSDIVDLNANRPHIGVVDGSVDELDWPRLEIVAVSGPRDMILLTGPEPSIEWRGFSDWVCGLAVGSGVGEAYLLGGMPAAVTHDREVAVLATATDAELGARIGPLRPDYTGPTGLQTVLQFDLASAGIPAGGLWAQVPPYVAASPAPPAIRALLQKLRQVCRIEVPLDPLADETAKWRTRVERHLDERPELAELVGRLREAIAVTGDTGQIPMDPDEVPSGEELAREIERFLRDQP